MILLIIVLLLLGTVAFLVYASFCINSGVYVKTLCKGETNERVVCLTFDDGPDPVYTPQVLDVLKEYQAQAAFFCIGKKVRENAAIMKRIAKEGHHVGNHTDNHSWKFPFLTQKKMYKDLLWCEDALLSYSGPILTFRPPFGVTNPTIARLVKQMRYTIIGWSIRSFDTRGESEDKVLRRIVRQIQPGSVILLHDRMPGCASLVARLLEHLKTIHYEVVPLERMFDIPNPYGNEIE